MTIVYSHPRTITKIGDGNRGYEKAVVRRCDNDVEGGLTPAHAHTHTRVNWPGTAMG